MIKAVALLSQLTEHKVICSLLKFPKLSVKEIKGGKPANVEGI